MIDLLVAGGGPVGLATALYAHRAGLTVAVAEPRRGSIDKACGEGLMPGAVTALAELGIEPPGQVFRGIRYVEGARRAEARFAQGSGLGVRRTTLHAAMREAVDAAGISVHPVRVEAISQDAHSVRAASLHARYLAAADGLHSPLRRELGLEKPCSGPARFGLRGHFAAAPWADVVEVHWSREAEAYVTPVAPDLVGVAILTSRRAPLAEHLRAFPALVERLSCESVTKVRGASPLRQRSSRRVAGRVLLVGDAAGYVDALTGEGVAVGLAAARELVRAVVRDDPQSYEEAWLEATRHYRWLTGSLLWARNSRVMRPTIVAAADRLPVLFEAAVNSLAR